MSGGGPETWLQGEKRACDWEAAKLELTMAIIGAGWVLSRSDRRAANLRKEPLDSPGRHGRHDQARPAHPGRTLPGVPRVQARLRPGNCALLKPCRSPRQPRPQQSPQQSPQISRCLSLQSIFIFRLLPREKAVPHLQPHAPTLLALQHHIHSTSIPAARAYQRINKQHHHTPYRVSGPRASATPAHHRQRHGSKSISSGPAIQSRSRDTAPSTIHFASSTPSVCCPRCALSSRPSSSRSLRSSPSRPRRIMTPLSMLPRPSTASTR